MSDKGDTVRIAVVQAAPVLMNKAATLEKSVELIAGAAEKGARILLFPEAFISAYPRGLSFGTIIGKRSPEGKRDFQRYFDNSVDVPGRETKILAETAGKYGVYLVMGVIEREWGTLYCTTLYFGPDGAFLGKHRKLKPTGSERIVWGEGDGSTLTVVETPYGRMGGLICWENYMPLARAAIYGKGVSLYVAPTADSREEWQATIRHIALEGRCFVLSCNQHVTKSMYPGDLACYGDLAEQPENMCPGGSAVLDPMGRYLAGPVFDREETLIVDLDLDLVAQSRFDFDCMGHYARPDVFKLLVNERPMRSIHFIGEQEERS